MPLFRDVYQALLKKGVEFPGGASDGGSTTAPSSQPRQMQVQQRKRVENLSEKH